MSLTSPRRVIVLALLAGLSGCAREAKAPDAEDRIKALEGEVENERNAAARTVEAYTPKAAGDINDIAAPAVEILRQLPGLVEVEVLVAVDKPAHRLIHLRDWHYVAPDLHALDVRHAAGKPLDDTEVVLLYRQHLLEVERVQCEQETLLRCLARHHHLRAVVAEGVTPEGLPVYRDIIASLRQTDRDLAGLAAMHATVQGKSAEVDRDVAELLRAHRQRLLEYGASGRLSIDRVVEVLPLDDGAVLQAATPVRPDGTVGVDAAKLAARHDANVQLAMASGPVAVIVLGGSHDLSASVCKLGGGTTEYVRVTTRSFRKLAGD